MLALAAGTPTPAAASVPAPPVDAGPGSTTSDPVAELPRLAAERTAGEISDAELANAKRQLMGT